MEVINRKANYDYEIIDTYEAGVVLTGTEIKSIRLGRITLKDSYAIIKNNEVFFIIIYGVILHWLNSQRPRPLKEPL